VVEREAPLPVHAREILEYYLANQRTVDTLAGIAKWLLLEQLVQRRVGDTETGLEWLVSHGFLERVTSSAAPTLYRLNVNKVDEATRLLQAPPRA
jgi:hypothetical protein